MTGEQPKQPPTFGAKSITWVQTELLSTLIAMLLDKRLISIDEAETIFAAVDKKLADHPSPDAPEAREFLNWLHQ